MFDLSGKNHRIQPRQMKKKSFDLIFVFLDGFMMLFQCDGMTLLMSRIH
jgi:hypothetical protein